MKKKNIKHIGNVLAICNRSISANLREDLGLKRYKQLGVKELFKNENPYRVCGNCLKVIAKRERR